MLRESTCLVSCEATDSLLDVLVTECTFVAFAFEESCEQDLDIPHWNLAVYEDMNGHAGLAEMKVDSGVIFCSRLIVAAQVLEGGFIGAEALRVAVGAYWIIHWLAD